MKSEISKREIVTRAICARGGADPDDSDARMPSCRRAVFCTSATSASTSGASTCAWRSSAVSIDLLWGYTGSAEPRANALLHSRRLCLWHAPHADDREAWPVQERPSGLHGLPRIQQAAHPLGAVLQLRFRVPLAVLLVPGIVAFIFGYLAFRSRIRGVYFSILTQALTYAACLLFFRNELTFGGNNGFTDFKTDARLSTSGRAATQRGLYIASAVALVGVYVFCRWLTLTKFAQGPAGDRDSENRVLLLRLCGGELQALRLCAFRHDRRPCRGALCTAGRHHQSQPDGARRSRSKPSCGSQSADAQRCWDRSWAPSG